MKVAADIKIGEQVLHLKVEPAAKELYELAEKRVNDILSENRDTYSRFGSMFELSMAAFRLALLLEDEQKKHKEEMERLSVISGKMDDFLKG